MAFEGVASKVIEISPVALLGARLKESISAKVKFVPVFTCTVLKLLPVLLRLIAPALFKEIVTGILAVPMAVPALWVMLPEPVMRLIVLLVLPVLRLPSTRLPEFLR